SWSEAFEIVANVNVADFRGCENAARHFVDDVARVKGAARGLFKALLPGRDDPSSQAAALERIVNGVRRRGGKRPRAIRLPLYVPKADATLLIWLAIVRAAARLREHVPAAFWKMDGSERWI